MRRASALFGAALAAALSAAEASAVECHAAIVFALDASRSVDRRESALQREGLAAALTDPAVMRAIAPYPGAAIAAMVFEWSDPDDQVIVAPWAILDDARSIEDFAAGLVAGPSIGRRWKTGIGPALAFAASALAAAPASCRRLVIDVSGDGPGNAGAPPDAVRAGGSLDGVTVNGLVIRHPALDSAQPPGRDPLIYYNEHVVQGPGAFVMVASSFEDYPPAIRRKLLRELAAPIALR